MHGSRSTLTTQCAIVAHHFTSGALPESAIGYWQRAGERAMARSANAESVRFTCEGLRLLGGLPRSLARSQQELGLRGLMGFALAAIKGYGADDVEQALGRARELCEELGDTPQLIPILYGLHAFYLVRADRRRTVELAEQLVHLTRDVTDAGALFMAVGAAGLTHFWQGDHQRAVADLERMRALYDPARHRALAVAHNQELGAVMNMYLGLVYWFLGRADASLARMEEALAIAGDPPIRSP
jgi:predicted ATPase